MFRTHDYLRHAFCRTQQVTRHVTATYVGMSIKQKISRFEFAKNLKESCGTKGLFLFNWANWPLFVYFRPIHNTMTNIVLNLKWKKRWWCAWGSNPEPRICKRRWIHCAIAASKSKLVKLIFFTKTNGPFLASFVYFRLFYSYFNSKYVR